jgi:antitoxin component YwqK of YwqJK toxin-antitoxin module
MSNKIFIPRKLEGEGSRWFDWNKDQPIVDGVQINQYDMEGRKRGYWEDYFNNGKLYSKGNYVNGKREGIWELYYNLEHYSVSFLNIRSTFKDGVLTGVGEYYFTNGQLERKGNYVNGCKDGLWKFYDYNGNLIYEKLFTSL